MIIPWPLIISLALAVGAAVIWGRVRGIAAGPLLDLASSLLLPAVVAGRLAVLIRDAVLLGGLPRPAAVLTLSGAGLSAGAAALVLAWLLPRRLAALQRPEDRRREKSTGGGAARPLSLPVRSATLHADDPRRRAAPQIAAVALTGWSLGALIRGQAAGIAAPVPLGIPLPGSTGAALPVALLEALSWAALAWWASPARAEKRPDARTWGAVGVLFAAQALLGPALRPALATPDADLETLLGLFALLVAVALIRERQRVARAITAVGTLVIVLVATAALVVPHRGTALQEPLVAAEDLSPSLAGAIRAGGSVAEVEGPDTPSLDAGGLAGIVALSDGPVVVNLWASWCPPCHAEAPAIGRAATALTADGVTFIGLLIDDAPQDGQAFADRYDLTFPTAVDAGAAAALGYAGLPTTIVLTTDGEVAHREIGGVDGASLAAAVQRARTAEGRD